MAYLLIPLLCVLAISKITLQSKFSKTTCTGIADNIFYNGIIFSTAALLFSSSILKNGVTYFTCVHGIIMGILSVAFQFFYICAFSKGKMTLTVIINNFSMLLPIIVSFTLFDEEFGVLKITGAILALISFIFSAAKEKSSTDSEASDKSTFQWLNTYAASLIDGSILYPAYNCGVSLLSTLAGRILFKEKLSLKQYIGVFIGTIAIVFLCL